MARENCRCLCITLICSVFLTFCINPMRTTYIAQTPSQVSTVLNSYTGSMNRTMEQKFLQDVHNSEVGLCLNLSDWQNRTVVVKTTLIALYVRRTNYSSVANAFLEFPCVTCSTPGLARAEVTFGNETTSPNISCLATSRFSDYLGSVDFGRARISDVFSLSLYASRGPEAVGLSAGDVVQLRVPLTKMANSSYDYVLECLSQENSTLPWSNSSCTANQTIGKDDNGTFVQCRCSTLGFFAVFVKCAETVGGSLNGSLNGTFSGGKNCTLNDLLNVTPNGTNNGTNDDYLLGSSREPVPPSCRLSLTLDANCMLYLSNITIKSDFLNLTTYTIAIALNATVSNIRDMDASCGSIVVNFTLVSSDGTNETLNRTVRMFGKLITTDSFKVVMDGARIYPFSVRTYGFPTLENTTFVSPYFYRKFATQPTIPPSEIQHLQISFKPIMIAVALVLTCVIACVCFTCCSHSWYLRKKKYTEFNSDKVVPKVEEPVVVEEEEEVAPPEFPMTYTERPKVDEHQMAKYDWARTSFAQEQTEGSAFVTSQAGQGLRLIVDCDSDSDSEGIPPSDGTSVTINIENGSEDDSDDDEGFTRADSSVSVKRSRADLEHEEEGFLSEPREQEEHEEHTAGHEDEVEDGVREEGEGIDGEREGTENREIEDEARTQDGERDNEERQNDDEENEERQNDDEANEERKNDDEENEERQNDDEATEERQNDDEATEERQNDDEVNEEQQSDDEANKGTNYDPVGPSSARREATMSRAAQGMPEPNM